MKKVIAIIALTIVGALGVNAQSARTVNEITVGYNFLTSNVSVERLNKPRYNEDTDSHGFTVGYTRYTEGAEAGKVGVLGLTGEVTANFDSNDAQLVTVMGGGIAKARNNAIVQPYAKVLVGVASQNVNRKNVLDTHNASVAFDLGAGVDWALKSGSRYGVRTGFDYVNFGFNSERQHGYRATVGLVF